MCTSGWKCRTFRLRCIILLFTSSWGHFWMFLEDSNFWGSFLKPSLSSNRVDYQLPSKSSHWTGNNCNNPSAINLSWSINQFSSIDNILVYTLFKKSTPARVVGHLRHLWEHQSKRFDKVSSIGLCSDAKGNRSIVAPALSISICLGKA